MQAHAGLRLPLQLLLIALACMSLFVDTTARAQAAAAGVEPEHSVIKVPTGVTTVVLGSEVTQFIECRVLPDTDVRVEMTLTDGNGTRVNALIVPRVAVFVNANKTGDATVQTQQFTIDGQFAGRFYLTYTLSGDIDRYILSAVSSVISVVEASQGWQGIWYELAFNLALFAAGLAFFVWRRLHRVELPIWRGHYAGLFERANYDDLDPTVFRTTYRDILGDSLAERVRKFVAIGAHDAYVCHTCGIPAALNLQFHVDAGHLFAVLSVFSLGVMLPVNYVSGKSQQGDSFQQTTFSNVPLHSAWYWVHVAYCYLVAGCVLAFILRQSQLASTLQKRTKRIVGARSLLIHHGLPPSTTSRSLRAALASTFPTVGIEEVAVLDDLTQVHAILHRRRELADALERMRLLDASFEHGTMSWNLLLCPGSVLVPSPLDVLSSYVCCKPCRYVYRHEQLTDYICPATRRRLRPQYSSVRSDREILDPRARSTIQTLDEELDFFPEDALRVYTQRQCVGAAFVVFASTAQRNAFVRRVNALSCSGRVLNALDSCAWAARAEAMALGVETEAETAAERSRLIATGSSCDAAVNELAPFLPKLVLESAPEPDDIIWENLKYRPWSVAGVLGFLARQVTTLSLLLLFSTPTAVLVYVKLDASSALYKDLEAHHTFLVTLFVSYLPSLLLIAVNWVLLAFLYYVTMTEPSISESRRTKIFLVKGFIYLVLSSVFLPSIGVTAVYLAVSGISSSSATYIESFLYKVSGTFFISYVLQRTFLGAILDLTRSAERVAYQPWVLARSVTDAEKRASAKPWPFYFGHDYALVLSVFMMVLLGSAMTPIIAPFGALYFYLKAATTKYNVLYVLPFSPGRGHIAQTAATLAFACLVGFEFTMTFVLLQVAGHRPFVAMLVLLSMTIAFYCLRISGVAAAVQRTLSDRRREAQRRRQQQQQQQQQQQYKTATKPTTAESTAITVASSANTVVTRGTYTDPFKVALSLFKLLGVNQFHRMTTRRTQLIYAFYRLRRHARMTKNAATTGGYVPPSPLRSPRLALAMADTTRSSEQQQHDENDRETRRATAELV